jgi:hypothetical protein
MASAYFFAAECSKSFGRLKIIVTSHGKLDSQVQTSYLALTSISAFLHRIVLRALRCGFLFSRKETGGWYHGEGEKFRNFTRQKSMIMIPP